MTVSHAMERMTSPSHVIKRQIMRWELQRESAAAAKVVRLFTSFEERH